MSDLEAWALMILILGAFGGMIVERLLPDRVAALVDRLLYRGRHRGAYAADWAVRRAALPTCSRSQPVGHSVDESSRHPVTHRSERPAPSVSAGWCHPDASPSHLAVSGPAEDAHVVGRATGKHAKVAA